ncbi:hypothetical protein SLA2020_415630 [Shorea laevis]
MTLELGTTRTGWTQQVSLSCPCTRDPIVCGGLGRGRTKMERSTRMDHSYVIMIVSFVNNEDEVSITWGVTVPSIITRMV